MNRELAAILGVVSLVVLVFFGVMALPEVYRLPAGLLLMVAVVTAGTVWAARTYYRTPR